ncbi:MAG: hypothetical protein Q8L34_01410 [Candidatus Woesearchaeota archaeon]|nr:hypothetical protein [Candidatus Woesearchaeota archaeon]
MSNSKTVVENMCMEMSEIVIPFERVAARFFEHAQQNGRCRDLGQLTGKLAEIHTLERAEELVRRHPKRMEVYWLPERTRERDKEYVPANNGTPNITVYNGVKIPIGEIDMVMFVDNVPVVVETHIAKFNDIRRSGVEQVLRRQMIDKKKEYVAQLLGGQPEVVYVIPENYLTNIQVPTLRIARYVQAGNHIVPFPMDRRTWRTWAESVVFQLV